MDRVHVLVTGSNGQLGNELQRLAAHDGAIRYTFVDADEMDLTRSDDIHEYFSQKQFDFIVNTAAYTDVDGAESNEDLAFAVNERAVAHLGEICLKSKTRLIHISTDYVFDGHAFRPLDESAEPNPLSVYGRSKLGGEKAVLSTLPDAYIVRTSWLYSSYGKNFVKTILRLAAERDSLSVVADQVGSPTYARDLGLAIEEMVVRIASGRVDAPGIYHYANEGVASWYDVASAIVRQRGYSCRIDAIRAEEYPAVAQRPNYSVLDKRKIATTFGLVVPNWYDSLIECLQEIPPAGKPGKPSDNS